MQAGNCGVLVDVYALLMHYGILQRYYKYSLKAVNPIYVHLGLSHRASR